MAALESLAAAALALDLLASRVRADKTDVLVLDNGDHITGEVMELDPGQLKFNASHVGTIYFDWTHVVSLTTNQNLAIELTDGTRLFGSAKGV